MRVNKLNHPNQGIKCEVDSCYYYLTGDYCTAEKIQIQPKNAKTTNDTDCVTFAPQG